MGLFNVGKRRLRKNTSALKYVEDLGVGGRGDILFQEALEISLDGIDLNCNKGDSYYPLGKAFGEQSKTMESFCEEMAEVP